MAEKAIYFARAVVYYFDPKTKNWAPTAVGTGFCRVDLYENPTNNTFRVIGRGLQDTSKIVINSNVSKDTQYTRASETFHQWSDNRYIYGLNFASKEDAETFGSGFESTVNRLKAPVASSAPPPPAPPVQLSQSQAPTPPTPPPQQPSRPVSTAISMSTMRNNTAEVSSSPSPPAPPAPPTPPTPPPPPTAPPAPPAPPVSSSGGGQERGALLASIQGFKGGLKKVQTNDRSAPAPSTTSGGSGSGGRGGGSAPSAGDMMGQMLAARKKIIAGKGAAAPPERQQAPPPAPAKSAPSTPKARPVERAPAPVPERQPVPERAPAPERQQPAPAPAPERQPAVAVGGSNISSAELNALKEEILAEVRSQLQAFKEEILEALRN